VAALLDDGGALAVVLAQDDDGAALHAGGGEVRQGIGGHVGANRGLESHGAAHRIVDRGAEHGGSPGLVGVGLDVHAKLVEDVARVVQHVHDVRHGGALVAADVGHARLQERLGHGQDRLAVEGLVVAQLELGDFFLE
jgi:hypothetical protein